jgi:hypothetical protein
LVVLQLKLFDRALAAEVFLTMGLELRVVLNLNLQLLERLLLA